MMLSIEYINEKLRYDEATGSFYWKIKPRRRRLTTDRAGTRCPIGYRLICIDQRVYKEHQLVWFMHHGYIPKMIDHKNGIKDDNRIENLREVTPRQNAMNMRKRSTKKSKLKGTYLHKNSGLWHARICINYKAISLGYYKTEEEAHAAYWARAQQEFGEFSNRGDGQT